MDAVTQALTLLDWKRRVFALYAEVRAAPDPAIAWRLWRETRDELFRGHPQSPLPEADRERFRGLAYFDHDPALDVEAELRAVEPEPVSLPASAGDGMAFRTVAVARFALGAAEHELEVYWLEGYGGGLFVPFRDATSGRETYGGGRYLLDTVKGADLGGADGRLRLDFNFAYNPSCSYADSWACPLPPPANTLPVGVRGGERVVSG